MKKHTVYVKFWNEMATNFGGKDYAYNTEFELAEGDLAVVCVGSKYQVVVVVRVNEGVDPKATKFIVDKVDTKAYRELCEREEKKERLLDKMNELSKTASQLKMFELLAEGNPEMKALLDEYKTL